MGRTKQIASHYNHMRDSYLTDIDMSGGMYLEMQERDKPRLEVIVTHLGGFYKACLKGVEITKEKLFEIIGVNDPTGFRLDHHVHEFQKTDNCYQIKVSEINVS